MIDWTQQPVKWKRDRVQNFGEEFALPYVQLLVRRDGQPYDQPAFYDELVNSGAIPRPTTASNASQERWESYLGPIRPYGLGFSINDEAVDQATAAVAAGSPFGTARVRREQRAGGPPRLPTWQVSPVARDLAAGRLTYRQFMALQVMRTQLPKVSLPAQRDELAAIQRGVSLRPLQLALEALDLLADRGQSAYLSEGDLADYVSRAENHSQLPDAIDAIVNDRTGKGKPAGFVRIDQPSIDIWMNAFAATGYVRKFSTRPSSGLPTPLIVRRLARRGEARDLAMAIPMQQYDGSPGAGDAYFDFLCASPSSSQMSILATPTDIVVLDIPDDGAFDPHRMRVEGNVATVGGIDVGDRIVLVGENLPADTRATIFEVVEVQETNGGNRLPTPNVWARLRPVEIAANRQPVDLQDASCAP